jgi:hypothetical protein
MAVAKNRPLVKGIQSNFDRSWLHLRWIQIIDGTSVEF